MTDNKPSPCICPAPNPECQRAGRPMIGGLWCACAGCGDFAGATSDKFRSLWDRLRREGKLYQSDVPQVRECCG